MSEFRKESDSLGEIDVPTDKHWGAQTRPSPGAKANGSKLFASNPR